MKKSTLYNIISWMQFSIAVLLSITGAIMVIKLARMHVGIMILMALFFLIMCSNAYILSIVLDNRRRIELLKEEKEIYEIKYDMTDFEDEEDE